LLRQIDISDSQVDHAGEGLKVAENAVAIPDDSDDAFDAFSAGEGLVARVSMKATTAC